MTSRDNIPERFLKRIQEAKEKQLEELDLSNNQLSSLPESLGNLNNLTWLDLSNNQLSSLPESLGNLNNLTWLDLSNNQLSSLPESLGNLNNLIWLDLSNNQLSSLPKYLGNLNNLIWLYLGYNQLSSLSESLGNLNNLTWLYLEYNQLSSLPESLGNLTGLIGLGLGKNQLSNLPESLGNLTNLTWLDVGYNPLVNPPIGILNRGTKAIKNYLRQLKEEGEYYIYEAKLLIVGEAGAGKTTLANKIKNHQYQLQENQASTEGIDVIKWSFPILDKEKNQRKFKVNIWDFGGQEIYHATHQFFLTKRSLYTLVADSRKEDTDFYYWLNVVELLSDNSPLLIIKNEKQDRQREINERALRGRFTNLKETIATNLKNNRGLEEILTNVKHYIQNLPHIGETLPKTWVKVRETLENDQRNYISLQEYLDICEANGFKRLKDKLQLSGYLHDLGVCLHFQDEEDSLLSKTVILKPEWGTDAVYKVLDSKQVINNQGCFTRNELKNIWHEAKYALMRGELLELMKKFQLCYEIPDRQDTFIAPQLLSDNQPEYDWNESHNLILRYAYPDFMPKGIISRFIVVMHEYIDQQKYVWKSGVILKKDNTNTKAEVIENYGKREIRIRVIGENKRNYMTIVTHELDKINDSYKRLKYQKLIPCNCEDCKYSQKPYFYSFKELQNLNNKRDDTLCQCSGYMVNIRNLIDDVIIRNKLDRDDNLHKYPHQQATTIINNYDKSNNMTTDNHNTNVNQEKYNKLIEGNYYEQKGNFGIGHMSGGEIKDNAKVAGVINEAEQQNLAQAAADIQALLKQLEETYPTDTTLGKVAIANEAIQHIDNDPKLTQRILSALKAGGTSALDSLLDHPAASFVIGALEDWQQTKNS